MAAVAPPPLPAGATVCVTGASGYLASVLVGHLKEAGYKVVGTVRDVAKYKDEECFKDVELFEADLLDAASWKAPFAKCQAVVHTAAPFFFPSPDTDYEKEFVRPSLEGTQNVLAALYEAGIRHVVTTSSSAAVTAQFPDKHPGATPGETRAFTEEDWSDDSTLELAPYRYSKRVAERAVWDFAAQHPDLHVACINPTLLMGPLAMTRASGESVGMMQAMLTGGELKKTNMGWVDVRDVADAHVRALQRPEANGKRFILSSEKSATLPEMAQLLREAAPAEEFAAYPLQRPPAEPPVPRIVYSTERVRTLLGITFRPQAATLLDMARDEIKRGIASPPPAEAKA